MLVRAFAWTSCLLFFAALAVPASAGVDQCSVAPQPSTRSAPGLFTISGTFAWQDGSGCAGDGSGVVGGGLTYSCPNPYGEHCGPFKLQGQMVTCWWSTSVGSTVKGLAVSIDANGDGNIWANVDPKLAFDKPAPLPVPLQTYAFTFVAQASGQVIAYPVSFLTGGSAADSTKVRCV